MRRVERVVTLTLLAMATAVGGAAAQSVVRDTTGGRALTLAEALQRAEQQSEQVTIAAAAVQRAEGSVVQARSAYLPQLNGTFSYGRTLKSQFQGLGGGAAEDTTAAPVPCDPFSPNPSLPLEQRVGALEAQLLCPADGGGGGFGGVDFSEIGFGAANNYNLGLSFAQPLFAGGRIVAQNRAAQAGRSAAEIGLASARAQLRLDATQAYYDAELAERMLEIAEATLALHGLDLLERGGGGAGGGRGGLAVLRHDGVQSSRAAQDIWATTAEASWRAVFSPARCARFSGRVRPRRCMACA